MVALKGNDAEAFLAAPTAGVRLFLVHGSDQGAITERARQLEKIALTRGRGEFVLRLGSDELAADPWRVADEAFSASLFGGEPVISLRILDGRHNVIGALQPLLERPPDAAWVVVEAAELAPTSPLQKAFEASPRAAALATYPLEGRDLASFIGAAAKEAGIVVEPEALELLRESLGGDRLASRGELEKLFLYAQDQRRITIDDVRAIVEETIEARTDQVIDAALLGDNEALETGLCRLRAEATSLVSVGTLALRHLIQLQTLRATMDTGASASGALGQARPPIHFRRRGAIETALRRWPSDAIADARRLVDRAIALTRLQPLLEYAAISETLHRLALTARRLKRDAG